MIKRFLLLPLIVLLSIDLIIQAALMMNVITPESLETLFASSKSRTHQLKKTYRLLKLKHLILEEQHAIFIANIRINNLLAEHHELQLDPALLGLLQTPSKPSESSPKEKKSLPKSDPATLSKQEKQTLSEESQTKLSAQGKASYQELKNFVSKVDKPLQKEASLELTADEKKSYQDLTHFIEEKKQQHQGKLTDDEKWLLATPGKSFTIQIFGAKEEAEAKDFIKAHKIKHAHLFHTYYLNKPWVAVVVDTFSSYNQALKQLPHYPHGDQPPWIRPLSSIHAAIKLYR